MKTILIIEDDAAIRLGITLLLEQQGYLVLSAENGRLGIEEYRRFPTEIVITDIHMPEKDGFEVIRKILFDFPNTPIIAMSAVPQESHDDLLGLAIQTGAKKALKKPFEPEELLALVESLSAAGMGDG